MIPGIRFAETRRHLAFAFALAGASSAAGFRRESCHGSRAGRIRGRGRFVEHQPGFAAVRRWVRLQAGPDPDHHDNLEARAFVVGKGKDALAFVSVDLVGWFAAYDGEQAPTESTPPGEDRRRPQLARLRHRPRIGDRLQHPRSRGTDRGRNLGHPRRRVPEEGKRRRGDRRFGGRRRRQAVRDPGPGSVTSVRSSGKTVRAPITLTVSSTTTPCRSSGPVIPTPARRMPSTPTSRTTRTSTRWTTTTSRCRPTGPATPGASSMP